MDFAIRTNADKWFNDIRGSLDLDFDIFYFCFIAGITENRKAHATSSDTRQLVENFPGQYRERGKLLVALFLSRKLSDLGLTAKDKEAIHNQISRLVRPSSPNYLSDDGVREFNKYAHGGFDVLQTWFDDRPRTLETFLRSFHRKVCESSGWSLNV